MYGSGACYTVHVTGCYWRAEMSHPSRANGPIFLFIYIYIHYIYIH